MLALATLNWERPTVAEDGGLQWSAQGLLASSPWLHCNIVCQNYSKGHVTEEDAPGVLTVRGPCSLKNTIKDQLTLSKNSIQTKRISNLLLKAELGTVSVLMWSRRNCCWTHSSCKPHLFALCRDIIYTYTCIFLPLTLAIGCSYQQFWNWWSPLASSPWAPM